MRVQKLIGDQVMDSGVWGPNDDVALEGLRGALKQWYDDNKDRYRIQGQLTLPRIKTSNDWPELKAKARATRHVTAFALKLATEHNSGSTHDKRRLAVCQLLCRFYDIISGESRFLTDDLKAELVPLAQNFMVIYEKLS